MASPLREGIAEKCGTNAGIGAAFPTGGGGISSSCPPYVASNFPIAPPASQEQCQTCVLLPQTTDDKRDKPTIRDQSTRIQCPYIYLTPVPTQCPAIFISLDGKSPGPNSNFIRHQTAKHQHNERPPIVNEWFPFECTIPGCTDLFRSKRGLRIHEARCRKEHTTAETTSKATEHERK